MVMKKSIYIAVGLFIALPIQCFAASFDCSKARTTTKVLICSDQQLNQLCAKDNASGQPWPNLNFPSLKNSKIIIKPRVQVLSHNSIHLERVFGVESFVNMEAYGMSKNFSCNFCHKVPSIFSPY